MKLARQFIIYALAFASSISTMEGKTDVKKDLYGKLPDGTAIDIYTMSEGAFEARVMTFGGYLVSLKVPDRKGQSEDVVLGFDNFEGYWNNTIHKGTAFLGPIVGRYANRIGEGKFILDGKQYSLAINNGPNAIHGGPHGFHTVVWNGKEIPDGVELTYLSKDGEEGYPGNLTVTVRYTLSKGALTIDYSATTDKDTILNLTNHTYFNLNGNGRGDILNHYMTLHASQFTWADAHLLPTGELKPVEGTPLDFRKSIRIGERIDADYEPLRIAGGYDQNWVIDGGGHEVVDAGEIYDPESGRVLRLYTDQPGVQVYTGNFFDGTLSGKGGTVYKRRAGLCLETQHFPDSPNHPNFPTTVLKPGERFHRVTTFSFSTR
ncbi:MAG TPA: aldose epimerase family protein [Candidatus Sulfotelmatobacter sp.]|nr:aldose epimerase family protein [Candidatus Sulfotelmatobacter sp.]